MKFHKATPDDCDLINRLAAQIWAPTYSHLMGADQLEYMFEMMYAPENLRRAMIEGGQTFLIFSQQSPGADNDTGADSGGGENASRGCNEADCVGYVAYETLGGGDYYLQKIYLLPSRQGQGSGRRMLELFLEHLRELDPAARRLGLNVNRDNRKAIDFYRRNGFEITSRRDHPIGHGYFMYDYIMERDI